MIQCHHRDEGIGDTDGTETDSTDRGRGARSIPGLLMERSTSAAVRRLSRRSLDTPEMGLPVATPPVTAAKVCPSAGEMLKAAASRNQFQLI